MKLLQANEGTKTHPPESPNMNLNNTIPAPTTSTTSSLHNGNDPVTINGSNNSYQSCNKTMSQYMTNNASNGSSTTVHVKLKASKVESETSLDLDDFDGECLEYTEEGHPSFVLAGINNLRKQGQFCDINLVVEDHEFPGHRAVLAACSPYLFDFLSCLEETGEYQPTYKLKDISFTGFHYLLDYMYTGRLHVPLDSVPVVYATSLALRMELAAKACAGFLLTHLSATNCLGIRRLTKDKSFKLAVDEYIRANLTDIMHSKSFYGLQDMQVEVVGLDENISDEAMERRLYSLILDWAKNNLNDLKPKMDRLIEKVNVLYLGHDNTLRDCADVEDSKTSDDDMVQDYKILARRRSKTPVKGNNFRTTSNGNGAQPFKKFSLNPEESVSLAEREWSIVATRKTNENAYLAIAILEGQLMVITVHIRPPVSAGTDSNGTNSAPDSPPISNSNKNRLSPVLRKASITPLVGMAMARCAMGAIELNGKLVVCGGYDRGECLLAVEAFTVKENVWTPMPAMKRGRARFSAAVLDGCVYVCGGSDGWKELASVEKYDPVKQKWSDVASMTKERSYHGVATLNGKLYCVGGSEGQRSVATCEVYDPHTNKWSPIASLKTARSQTCVCAVNGMLFAIGGTDLWNTLNTVEVYNPQDDEWVVGSSLNIARRGAGVGIVNGQVVVCGGSDGTQSLVSTEMYDFENNSWTMGPPMNTPRANLSVVTIGDRLFAVGGFSGKKFLTTLEWLDLDDMDWFGHTPREDGEVGARGEEVKVKEVGNGGGGSGDGQMEVKKVAEGERTEKSKIVEKEGSQADENEDRKKEREEVEEEEVSS